MKYLKINAALEVIEISDQFPDGARESAEAWARQPIGGYREGCAWSYGAGWLNRNDISAHPAPWMFVQQLADSASKLDGKAYIAADSGPNVSPRYDVIEAPKIGDEVSKAFNGDFYPVGRVVAIQKNYRRIRVEGPRGPMIFCRRGESGAWLNKGMWSLVPGSISQWNPEF